MNRLRKLLTLGAVLAGVALLAVPTQARADFELRASNDGGATFAFSNSDTNGAPLSLTVGTLNIIASTTSNNLTGFASIDLGISGNPTAAFNVVIQATLTGILTGPPPENLHFAFGADTFGNSALYTSGVWVDQSNQDFGGATFGSPGGTNVVAHVSPQGVPASGNVGFTANSPYSATVQTQLQRTGTGPITLSQDSGLQITPGPAPAGLVLLLTGIPALGLGWLRGRKKAKE